MKQTAKIHQQLNERDINGVLSADLFMKKISSKKEIKIRSSEPDDYQALGEIYNCRKVFAGTLQLPYASLEMWRKRLSDPSPSKFSLVAVVSDKVVGHLGLDTFPNHPRRKHVGTFGMGVHDDWQGKGIGKALLESAINLAENWLNIMRLELEVYVDNEPAIKLYQQFGFEHEGTLRQHAFRDGRYVDSYSMARIRASE